MNLMHILTLFIIHFSANAITLDDVLQIDQTNAPENLVQDADLRKSKLESLAANDIFIPNVSVFYNLTDPYNTHFSAAPTGTYANFGPVIAGYRTQSYGINARYDFVNIIRGFASTGQTANLQKAKEANVSAHKSEIRLEMIKAYMNLFLSHKITELNLQSVQSFEKKRSELNIAVKYGARKSVDLALVDAEMLNAEEHLKRSNVDLDSAKDIYKNKIGVIHENLEMPRNLDIQSVASNIDDAVQIALKHNKSILSAESNARASGNKSSIALMKNLPSIVGSYSHLNNNYDLQGLSQFTQDRMTLEASFSLTSLFANTVNASVAKAEAKYYTATVDVLKKDIESKVRSTWKDCEYYNQNILSLERIVTARTQVYNAIHTEVTSGKRNFSDELTAKTTLDAAKLDLVKAKINKTLKIFELKALLDLTF